MSSWVRSMKGCFGGMITSLCFLEVLEMEDFGDSIVDENGCLMKVMVDEVKGNCKEGFYIVKMWLI